MHTFYLILAHIAFYSKQSLMWLFIVTTQRLKQTVLLPDFFFEKPIDQFAFAKTWNFSPPPQKI